MCNICRYASWSNRLPRIHVYAFSTDVENPLFDVALRSARVLGCDVKLLNYRHDERNKNKCKQSKSGSSSSSSCSSSSSSSSSSDINSTIRVEEGADDVEEKDICTGYIVRDVSPKKVMVCLSFRLPREVCRNAPNA